MTREEALRKADGAIRSLSEELSGVNYLGVRRSVADLLLSEREAAYRAGREDAAKVADDHVIHWHHMDETGAGRSSRWPVRSARRSEVDVMERARKAAEKYHGRKEHQHECAFSAGGRGCVCGLDELTAIIQRAIDSETANLKAGMRVVAAGIAPDYPHLAAELLRVAQ